MGVLELMKIPWIISQQIFRSVICLQQTIRSVPNLLETRRK